MATSNDLEHRETPKPEADFVLQQVFCWSGGLQRCLVTLLVNWELYCSEIAYTSENRKSPAPWYYLSSSRERLFFVSYTYKHCTSESQQHKSCITHLHIQDLKSWQKVFHKVWFSLENSAHHPPNHVSKPFLREPVCLEITSKLFSFTSLIVTSSFGQHLRR